MNKLTLIQDNDTCDWEVWILNGKVFFEGHEIGQHDILMLLEELDVKVERRCLNMEDKCWQSAEFWESYDFANDPSSEIYDNITEL